MVATPLVGVTRFNSMRRVVVLPDPFGPRNPVTRPGWTVNDNPSTALTFGYTLVSPDTTSWPSMRLPSPANRHHIGQVQAHAQLIMRPPPRRSRCLRQGARCSVA